MSAWWKVCGKGVTLRSGVQIIILSGVEVKVTWLRFVIYLCLKKIQCNIIIKNSVVHTVLSGHTKHKTNFIDLYIQCQNTFSCLWVYITEEIYTSLIIGQELATKSTTHRLGSNKKKISNELIVANLRLLSQNLCQVI